MVDNAKKYLAVAIVSSIMILFSACGNQQTGGAYTVTVKDQNGEGVSGCVVNFCDESSCTPVTQDKDGVYSFDGQPYAYHIQVVRIPDGYDYDTSIEYTADEAGGNIEVTLTKE